MGHGREQWAIVFSHKPEMPHGPELQLRCSRVSRISRVAPVESWHDERITAFRHEASSPLFEWHLPHLFWPF